MNFYEQIRYATRLYMAERCLSQTQMAKQLGTKQQVVGNALISGDARSISPCVLLPLISVLSDAGLIHGNMLRPSAIRSARAKIQKRCAAPAAHRMGRPPRSASDAITLAHQD
jgi:hypothetical protein